MYDILTGQFFWGIIIGLLLSFVGSWALAHFNALLTKKNHKKLVILFCIDTISNLQNIINEMDQARDRSRAIHHDFLALIDVEISVYGRNREHLIHLPKTVREQIRKYINDCGIKKADIVSKLDQFYRLNTLANQVRAEGRGPEAERIDREASVPLGDAQNAADKLVTIASKASGLLDDLSKL